MKKVLLFVCVVFSTMLLVAGVMEIMAGDRAGWLYILGAVFCLGLGWMPGRRARDRARRMDA